MLVAVGQSQSINHAREDKKSRNKCPAKRFFSLSLNHIPIARHWPWEAKEQSRPSRRDAGGKFSNATGDFLADSAQEATAKIATSIPLARDRPLSGQDSFRTGARPIFQLSQYIWREMCSYEASSRRMTLVIHAEQTLDEVIGSNTLRPLANAP